MLWTLQLSPWAIPPLVALFLLGRELLFLWPRRREPTSRALIPLVVASGIWTLFHTIAVVTPDLTVKVLLERAQYVAIAIVPVAWARFAIGYGQRPRYGSSRAMLALYAVTAVTIALALHPDGFSLLVRPQGLFVQKSGLAGLVVEYGPWFWVEFGARLVALIAATTALTGWMARSKSDRRRAPLVVLACLVALGPSAAHLASQTGAQWLDMSPTGFGVAATLLGWGLLRHRLLNLGPVARTLVMVELRDPIVVLDGRGRIVDVNRAAETMLGLDPYGDVPLSLGRLWASSRGKDRAEPFAQLVLPAVDDNGITTDRTFDVTLTPLGKRIGEGRTAFLFKDVTEREHAKLELVRMNAELEHEANTDALTGLSNRRRFMEALERETERAVRYDRPLSILLLDLDSFKIVNDTHGHAAGDAVLERSADSMRSVCRDLDLPARIGGEEFAVLLPETDRTGAAAVAERLRSRIGDEVHTSPTGVPFYVTASIGVAGVDAEAHTPSTVLHMADDALYAAKDGGRNRVVVRTAEGDAAAP